ncbi:MAG: thiamine phosphate synthase [Fuerstiella sp.]|nr:thiamine phosphate synthase [Fuerstiella sp.]
MLAQNGQAFGVFKLPCDDAELLLTPSVFRILQRVAECCGSEELAQCTGHLICVLLEQECPAGDLLRSAGVTTDDVATNFFTPAKEFSTATHSDTDASVAVRSLHLPSGMVRIIEETRRIARMDLRSAAISSQHLLSAMLQFNTPVCRTLRQHGVTAELLLTNCGIQEAEADSVTVRVTSGAEVESSGAADHRMLSHDSCKPSRVLDACMNRAREGIRVLEDCARFVTDDSALVRELKDLRHRLAVSEQKLAATDPDRVHSHSVVLERDVPGDCGTGLTGSVEQIRHGTIDIVNANSKRIQESLRSLEEFGKLISSEFSVEMKQLRYRAYEIHQRMLTGVVFGYFRLKRLGQATVCVLITEQGCRHGWKQVVESCLQGGADMIQLREKHLDDSELLSRAKWLAQICHEAGALCIVNDRSDIAYLSGADGVHLGQQDCCVKDVRRVVGADLLIGLSTHNAADIDSAAAHAADYLGVGPVFASSTKHFDSLAGPELMATAGFVTKPWFAIGGIDRNRVEQVAGAGAQRIAVSSAVIGAEEPDRIVRDLSEWFNDV